jgi:hypothetical protein
MTILTNPPQPGGRPAATRRYRSGNADETARRTDAWEHETCGEEQARWERETKAEWDARVAIRQANDDAQKVRHALTAAQRVESHDPPAAGIIPEPMRIHDEPAPARRRPRDETVLFAWTDETQ